MTITAQSIISDALQRLGVYDPGDTITAADSTLGLGELNNLLDVWESQFLPIYQVKALSVSLVIGTPTYNVSPREPRIIQGPAAHSVTISSVTTNIDTASAIEWASIFSIAPGTGTPTKVFYDPRFPTGILNFAPTPNATGTAAINLWDQPLNAFANLTTAYSLTTGTIEALETNLAISLKPYFSAAQIDPLIIAKAMESKKALKYLNVASRSLLGRSEAMPPAQPTPDAAA